MKMRGERREGRTRGTGGEKEGRKMTMEPKFEKEGQLEEILGRGERDVCTFALGAPFLGLQAAWRREERRREGRQWRERRAVDGDERTRPILLCFYSKTLTLMSFSEEVTAIVENENEGREKGRRKEAREGRWTLAGHFRRLSSKLLPFLSFAQTRDPSFQKKKVKSTSHSSLSTASPVEHEDQAVENSWEGVQSRQRSVVLVDSLLVCFPSFLRQLIHRLQSSIGRYPTSSIRYEGTRTLSSTEICGSELTRCPSASFTAALLSRTQLRRSSVPIVASLSSELP